jgi:protocatechuate 3,4-dioxygenase beta subunit
MSFDDTPPVVDFAPVDVGDPTRVDVHASDATSPLVQTEIEARRRGSSGWITLPTHPTQTGFTARLDDEALPNGRYELRARAMDSAGNERSTYREASGKLAVRKVPLRIDTRLVAGQIRIVKARRTRGGRRRQRRVIVVRPKVAFGRIIPIRGRLTTEGGNAVANAAIEVWEKRRLPGAASRRIAVIGTNDSGRFTFKALRGPSRILRFRYPGTTLVRARATEVELRVNGSSTIGVNRRRVVNGEEILLRGRVRGGPLPAVGKLVQLQAYSRGRWLTFATPRARRESGRWSYRYRFTATRGTVRYRFRARLPQESGFPYISGGSRTVRVLVRGL